MISHFKFKLSNDFKCQLMTSFCLQIVRILYGNVAMSDLWKETFQMSRINAINIVSSTDVTFRKVFHLKESSLTLFPFANAVNLVYFLELFTIFHLFNLD